MIGRKLKEKYGFGHDPIDNSIVLSEEEIKGFEGIHEVCLNKYKTMRIEMEQQFNQFRVG